MQVATGILIVVATLFVAADCFLHDALFQELKRQSDDESQYDTCLDNLEPCIDALQSSALDLFNPDAADQIKSLCTLLQTTNECLATVDMAPCNETLPSNVIETIAPGSYLCSGWGQHLVKNAQSSPCYSDPSRESAGRNATIDCFLSTITSKDLCLDAVARAKCAVEATSRVCGADLALLFDSLYMYLINLEPTCIV